MSNNNPYNLKVGQTLLRVDTLHRKNHQSDVVVEKIGRKWAVLSGYGIERVNMMDLRVDGGDYSSPARCFLSEDDYKEYVKANDFFIRLKNRIGFTLKSGVKSNDIVEAAKLLGVELD